MIDSDLDLATYCAVNWLTIAQARRQTECTAGGNELRCHEGSTYIDGKQNRQRLSRSKSWCPRNAGKHVLVAMCHGARG